LRLAGKLLGEHPVGGGFIFAIAEVPTSMANMALVPQAAVASEPKSGDLRCRVASGFTASKNRTKLFQARKTSSSLRPNLSFWCTQETTHPLVPVEFRSGHAKVG
jgi:hypothetical protein